MSMVVAVSPSGIDGSQGDRYTAVFQIGEGGVTDHHFLNIVVTVAAVMVQICNDQQLKIKLIIKC
jgi:hypothetical protein